MISGSKREHSEGKLTLVDLLAPDDGILRNPLQAGWIPHGKGRGGEPVLLEMAAIAGRPFGEADTTVDVGVDAGRIHRIRRRMCSGL